MALPVSPKQSRIPYLYNWNDTSKNIFIYSVPSVEGRKCRTSKKTFTLSNNWILSIFNIYQYLYNAQINIGCSSVAFSQNLANSGHDKAKFCPLAWQKAVFQKITLTHCFLYVFYTNFWASKMKIYLPSRNLHLSREPGSTLTLEKSEYLSVNLPRNTDIWKQ